MTFSAMSFKDEAGQYNLFCRDKQLEEAIEEPMPKAKTKAKGKGKGKGKKQKGKGNNKDPNLAGHPVCHLLGPQWVRNIFFLILQIS